MVRANYNKPERCATFPLLFKGVQLRNMRQTEIKLPAVATIRLPFYQ